MKTYIEAACEILGDGHDFELRRATNGWQLYMSRFPRSASGGDGVMVEAYLDGRPVYSRALTEAEAWEDVARQVMGAVWRGL
jgi:hypothetical protein